MPALGAGRSSAPVGGFGCGGPSPWHSALSSHAPWGVSGCGPETVPGVRSSETSLGPVSSLGTRRSQLCKKELFV